jgi:hypothetical protein
LRERRDVSQEAVAQRAGLTVSAHARIETDDGDSDRQALDISLGETVDSGRESRDSDQLNSRSQSCDGAPLAASGDIRAARRVWVLRSRSSPPRACGSRWTL